MTEVRVSDHKTPEISPNAWRDSVMRELMNHYGHLVRRCGYCGEAHIKMYVCSCGFQKVYANDLDAEGNLVEVWGN